MAHGNRRRGRAARSRTNRLSAAKFGSSSRGFARPLWLEQLEDRRMMAVFSVTNLGDLQFNDEDELETAPGTLRAAVEASNETPEADTIFFNPNLSGTIFLQRVEDDFGQLTIEGSVQIVGTGTRKITIAAADNRRVFAIDGEGDDPINVSISGLTITGGTAFGDDEDGHGGGILNNDNLILTEVDLSNNRATSGGGIYNVGSLTVERSLIRDNTATVHGGGIQNGDTPGDDGGGTEDGPPPATFITSSTITGNRANVSTGYGGGLFNGNGTLDVQHCTIVSNHAYLGSGIGSWGNPPAPEPAEGEEPEDPPPPVVFTTVEGSILFRNFNRDGEGVIQLNEMEIDIDVVGKGEEDDEGEPAELDPSINVEGGGNNLIWGYGQGVTASPSDIGPLIDPNFFDSDVEFGDETTNVPTLSNLGGSTNVFHVDPAATMKPTVDHHGGGGLGPYDQRGRHFVRTFELDAEEPRVDLGAVEYQAGLFEVDILADELNDFQYSSNEGVDTVGDFSIREALLFSELNPEYVKGGETTHDTVTFSIGGQIDPTPSSAPTLLLANGQIFVNHSVNILGPSSFILEIDGNDPSTVFANGTRIFNVTDGDDNEAVDVTIRNLTLLAGDVSGSGGAILNRENLLVENITLRNNRASLDGGAIHHDRGTLDVISSTISGNNASDDGAIYIAPTSGAVVISNATISGNSSGDRGAGFFNRGTDTRIEFSTITNNSSGSTIGSGVMSWSGELTIYSTIISGNFLMDVAANGATPVTTSEGFNLVGTVNAAASGTFGGTDIFSTTPGLAPLAFAGGLTQTHALLIGSPAINRGDETPTNAPSFDQRGEPFERIFDGIQDGIAELRMDIGAYELQGRVLIVDSTANGSDGNYTAGNFTLQEAIELANLGPLKDFIEFDTNSMAFSVSNPTISPSGALIITDHVTITWTGAAPLTLSGSGTVFNITNGNAGTFIDVDVIGGDPGVNPITFSGRNIVNLENLSVSNVVMLGNSTSAITHQLGMLDIRTSQLTGNISSVSGGAINAQNAKGVYIYDSTFTGNSTAFTGGHGGAIYLKNTPFEANLIVLANNLTAAGASDGAGLYVDNSGISPALPSGNDVKFTNSVISGNSTIGANSDGAGIFAKNADIFLSDDTTVALNTTFGTTSKGGAIYLNGGGSLTISNNVKLTFNRTLGQGSSGGAIASVGGTVNITATNVDNNTTQGADAHGGAIYIQDGSLSVIDSTFFDNSTKGLRADGGAIFSNTNLAGKQTTILNSTISGNIAADRGGGLYNADGLTVIKHSTITNNAAPYFGFGAGVGSFGNSTTTKTQVGNSIIAGNVVHPDYADMPGNMPSDVDRINGNFQESFQSLGYNLIGMGVTGAFTAQSHDFFNVADPGLEKFETHGGQTLTWSLKEGSLAIDGGDPSADAGQNGVPLKDQRGKDRVFNEGAGGRLDIGAFESSLSGALPGDFNGDGVVNGRDFLAWQRGNSPSPVSSGDLASWQANYGTGVALVATVVTTEETETPMPLAVLIDEAPESVVAVPTEDNQASNTDFVGWFVMPSSNRAEPAPVESSTGEFADEYLAAYESEFTDLTLAATETDFGDIATSRSRESEESDDMSAEDAVFELIGSGTF